MLLKYHMSNGEKGKGGKGRETAGWIQCREKKRRSEHTGKRKWCGQSLSHGLMRYADSGPAAKGGLVTSSG